MDCDPTHARKHTPTVCTEVVRRSNYEAYSGLGKGRAVQTSYTLEVYLPYSTEHVIESISSTTPFLKIQRGDVINPASLASVAPLPTVPLLLKVVGVEHLLEKGDSGVTHRVLVYTTEIPDNRRARLQQFRTKRPYSIVSLSSAG